MNVDPAMLKLKGKITGGGGEDGREKVRESGKKRDGWIKRD